MVVVSVESLIKAPPPAAPEAMVYAIRHPFTSIRLTAALLTALPVPPPSRWENVPSALNVTVGVPRFSTYGRNASPVVEAVVDPAQMNPLVVDG
tara:strand:+ start:287 stop:568 length:282 start_codon:yes stop_codon:yes gene_type:complete